MYRCIGILTCILTSGCGGKSEVPSTVTALTTESAVASARAERQLPKPDPAKPLTEYQDVNADPFVLMYLVTAKSPTPISQEDKLNRFSISYVNESDAFKRQEIAATEGPRIAAELDLFGSVQYLALPVGDEYLERPMASAVTSPVGISTLEIGPYDLASKSFPVLGGNTYCWAIPVQDAQGAGLKITPSEFPCELPVSDSAQAKAIESARSQNAIDLRGTLYLFAPAAESRTAVAVVTHAQLEVVNTHTKEVLASVNL